MLSLHCNVRIVCAAAAVIVYQGGQARELRPASHAGGAHVRRHSRYVWRSGGGQGLLEGMMGALGGKGEGDMTKELQEAMAGMKFGSPEELASLGLTEEDLKDDALSKMSPEELQEVSRNALQAVSYNLLICNLN